MSAVEELWALAWEDAEAKVGPLLAKANFQVDKKTWVSAKEIQVFVEETQDCNWAYRGSSHHKLTTFIKTLHKSAAVVDVVVQSQPFQVSLAWGTARFIILVALASVEVAERLAEVLADVLCHIQSWNIEAEVFANSQAVCDQLRSLFECVIVLLIRARVHLCSHRIKRMFKSAFSSDLTDTLRSIEIRSQRLDHRIRAESVKSNANAHKEQRAFHSEISNSLKKTSEKMELYSSSIRNFITGDADLETVLRWLGQCLCAGNEISMPEPGTCEWFYKLEKWQTWNASPFPTKCLLITGLPGSGKSVLTNSLAEKLKNMGSDYVLYYSFGATSTSVMKEGAGFVVSTLHAILKNSVSTDRSRIRDLLDEFTPLINTWADARKCPLEKLLKILEAMFGMMPNPLLIVDALDECLSDRTSLLDFFIRLSADSQARIVISARDYLLKEDISQAFIHVSVDLESTQHDIARFVDQRILRSPRLKKLQKSIRGSVLEHCRGIFLQAVLMLDALQQPECGTIGAQKQKMANFKNSLSETYHQLLEDHNATLSAQEILHQEEIFMIVVAAREPLTADEVYQALLIHPDAGSIDEDDMDVAPAEAIIRLCKPFLKIGYGDSVQIIHATAREYLVSRVSQDKSDLYLARKTLSQLTLPYYRQWKTPAALLRRHLLSETIYSEGDEEPYSDEIFYQYSVKHFQDHVTTLNQPPEDVITKLARFLQGIEYVSYSEVLFDLNKKSGLGPQVLVYKKLLQWISYLPPTTRAEIPIEDYFEVPHRHLSEILIEKSQDKILQYLPFVRLGDYYNVAGQTIFDFRKAYDFKKEVVNGVTSLLGARNPVTLRFRVSMLREYFWQKRFDEAYKELCEVVEIQRDVFKDKVLDIYLTLELLAGSLYCMTRFSESLPIYDDVAAGITELLSDTHPQFFMNDFFQGQALEQYQPLEEAAKLYQDVLDRWVTVVGELNPLGLMARVSLGSVQRKQGKYELAQANLLEGYAGRKQFLPIDNNVCLDTAVQLALLYRDIGKLARAVELLDSVSDSQVYQEDFERNCLTQHIRALIKLDAGEYEAAKRILVALLDLVTGDDRDKNNRELMWVRCTLADAQRQQGEGDNVQQWFENLVKPIEERSTSIPNTFEETVYVEANSELHIAEQAVRLVKDGKQSEAYCVLQKNGLQWVREKDFWILGQGGPIPDTARIRPVNLDTPILIEGASLSSVESVQRPDSKLHRNCDGFLAPQICERPTKAA